MGDLQETLLQDGDGAGGNNTYGTNSQLPAASPFQDRPSTDVLEAEEGRAGSSTKDANAAIARRIALSIYLSLAANVLLMAVKTVAFVSSGSMSVLASAVDSLVDLLSQAVISAADWAMSQRDERYPAGKARLEPISVLACAFIMTLGALSVIQESAVKLYAGLATGVLPMLDLGPLMFGVLGLATLLKLPLWWQCTALKRYSGAAEALAEDHLNDCFSNLGAIITAAVAAYCRQLWWTVSKGLHRVSTSVAMDPLGGILISVVIIWRWIIISASSVAKVVGVVAAPDVLQLVQVLAEQHHPSTTPGFVRAYHAGQRVAVDCELEAPAHLTVLEAAAISRDLKEKLEALPEVETASVLVVPLGTHTAVPQEALLLPDSMAKPPGQSADGVEDAAMAASPALSCLASACLATAATWRTPPFASAILAAHAQHEAAAASSAAATAQPDLQAGTSAAAAAGPSAAHKPPAAPSFRQQRPSRLPLEPTAAASLSRRMTAPPAVQRQPTPARLGEAAVLLPSVRGRPEHGYAERVAWMRGLRDAPTQGIRAATFRRRDTNSLLMALDRRPTLVDRMEVSQGAAAAASAHRADNAV